MPGGQKQGMIIGYVLIADSYQNYLMKTLDSIKLTVTIDCYLKYFSDVYDKQHGSLWTLITSIPAQNQHIDPLLVM